MRCSALILGSGLWASGCAGNVPRPDSGFDTPVPLDSSDSGTTDPANEGFGHRWEVYGCQWAFVAGTDGDAAFVVGLRLPEDDQYAEADAAYERALDEDESLTLIDGDGGDTLDLFDCNDVIETYTGHRWEALTATVHLFATYIRSEAPNECSGDHENVFYDATLYLTDVLLSDGAGDELEIGEAGPFYSTIGWNACGG